MKFGVQVLDLPLLHSYLHTIVNQLPCLEAWLWSTFLDPNPDLWCQRVQQLFLTILSFTCSTVTCSCSHLLARSANRTANSLCACLFTNLGSCTKTLTISFLRYVVSPQNSVLYCIIVESYVNSHIGFDPNYECH